MGPAVRRDQQKRGGRVVATSDGESGERPVYRAMPLQNGSWSILGFEWLRRRERRPLRAWGDCGGSRSMLGVAADTFDVEP